jgi:signal transduction histidine kinase
MFQSEQTHRLIPDINDGYGVAFRDIDGDNLPDIYLVCFRSLNRLLINRGKDQTFLDATIESGLGGNLMPMGIMNLELGTTIVDMDNDGDGDIAIAGWGVTTSLFRNEGNYNFTNITQQMDFLSPLDGNASIAADINNDGLLDLFFTDEHYSNRMYLNSGNCIFKDITLESGLQFIARSQGAGFCDVDLDGDVDLYIPNWFKPDLFFQNLGNERFKLMNLPIESCRDSNSTNSVSFGDIDNDGDFDFLITNREGMNYLYRNETAAKDSNWIFTNISREAGLDDINISYGSVMGDFDHDGWLDIFITNIGTNQFYLNCRNGKFQKVYQDPLTGSKKKSGYSTGAAWADYDADGDLDLFVANKDTFSLLFINPVNNNNYIKLKIQGIKSNRDAIGTRLKFYASGQSKYLLGTREISGGSGYFSLNEPLVHFGLDTFGQVDVEILFPSGRTITKTGLKKGRTYHIDEYEGVARFIILSSRKILQLIVKREFWIQILLILLFIILITIFIRLGLKRYQWNSVTTSGYVMSFFLIVLVIMIIFRKWNILFQFMTIDVLTLTFGFIFTINSERIFKLKQFRTKYRSILLQLSNQIVHIHDNTELMTTVINNILQYTEFETCCALLYDKNRNCFTETVCKNIKISIETIDNQIQKQKFIQILKKRNYISRIKSKKFDPFFKLFKADFIFAVQREENFLGCLTMGTKDRISPLNDDDLALFTTITNQMAIALENNDYIRQSNEMIEKLTVAKVREKYLKELERTNKSLDEKNNQLQSLYDELKDTETQLIHSEKMASLGQLVAGIAHELNNPIAFIYANIKQLKTYTLKVESFLSAMKQDADRDRSSSKINVDNLWTILPDINNLISDTIQGSQMVKKLVDNLRQFSHLDQAGWKPADIHEGIENSLMILKPEIKDRIKTHKDYNASKQLDCNIGQLNQVFLNLLINATQAIKEKGNIWIKTINSDTYVIIEIRDDGQGIPSEIHNKIFDPFFTTKDVGQGIGLGLSISYSIIKNHNGTIEVESDPKKGTTFRIKLPFKKNRNIKK